MEKLRYGTVERTGAPNHRALLGAPLFPVPLRVPRLTTPIVAQDVAFKRLTLLLSDLSQIHLTWFFVCAPLSLHNS